MGGPLPCRIVFGAQDKVQSRFVALLTCSVICGAALLPGSAEAARCAGCDEYVLDIPDPKQPTLPEDETGGGSDPAPVPAPPASVNRVPAEAKQDRERSKNGNRGQKRKRTVAPTSPPALATVIPAVSASATAPATGPWEQLGGSLAFILLTSAVPAALVLRNRRRSQS